MDQPSSTESNAIIIRIKFKSASLDEFISRYGVDVSPGGIFIRTKQPVEVGTSLQFDFTLADGTPLLAGLGTVAWVRESDPARTNNIPGMGLRFDKLSLESQHAHQTILAEKARREGKSLSTPYPPTAFVAPATRLSMAPEVAHPAMDAGAKPEHSLANLAAPRAAQALVSKATPPPPTAPSGYVNQIRQSDEYEAVSKTGICDKPMADFLIEMSRTGDTDRGSISKTAEEAVPTSLLEEYNTAEEALAAAKGGRLQAGALVQETSPAIAEEPKPAPAKPAFGERKTGDKEAFASLFDRGMGAESAGSDNAAPIEVLEELSAGAPLDESMEEKTEEVSMYSANRSEAAPAPFASGGAPLDIYRPPSRNAALPLKTKGSGKRIAGIAVLTAAAAFGAVYLVTTKPWQREAAPEPQPAVAVTPSPTANPVVPAPEPAKPAATAEAVAKKPVAEKANPAAAAEKPEARAPAAEKPAAEKAMVAKVAPGTPASRTSGKSAGKASEENSGAEEEVGYRHVFRSSPIGAEVLIDGEYFGRTPCERRVLDPKKSVVITFQREGYETHERMLGESDNWVKKGHERVLTVFASLRKTGKSAADNGSMAAPAKPEDKTEKSPEPTPAAKPETKPAAQPPEPAKPAAAKPEPAKAAATPMEKPTVFKPVPNFDEPDKAKE
jgi:uncharacterized protein (TIGR02266 family)